MNKLVKVVFFISILACFANCELLVYPAYGHILWDPELSCEERRYVEEICRNDGKSGTLENSLNIKAVCKHEVNSRLYVKWALDDRRNKKAEESNKEEEKRKEKAKEKFAQFAAKKQDWVSKVSKPYRLIKISRVTQAESHGQVKGRANLKGTQKGDGWAAGIFGIGGGSYTSKGEILGTASLDGGIDSSPQRYVELVVENIPCTNCWGEVPHQFYILVPLSKIIFYQIKKSKETETVVFEPKTTEDCLKNDPPKIISQEFLGCVNTVRIKTWRKIF